MRIDAGIFFGVVFLLFGLGLLFQAAYLKWREKLGWEFKIYNHESNFQIYDLKRETQNTLGNISLILSTGFLVSAVIVYFKSEMVGQLFRGIGILAFVTIFIGIIYISVKGW